MAVEQVQSAQLRRAVVASAIGTAIEWYDFFLYGLAAALVFPQLFFPTSDPFIGAILAFSTFFIGFVARPLGAAIFGHYGDRLGRKASLVATLVLMGAATFLIGLVPTYESIGIWGAVLLTLLRTLQGIGVGGEWGGSVLLALEWGHGGKRGFLASWPQFGAPLGLLLATGALAFFNATTGDAFLTWGWRLPFLLSVVLVGIGLFIRIGIQETPVFEAMKAKQVVEKMPVLEVFRLQWKEILLTALSRTSQQIVFYLFTVFILDYGTKQLGFPRGDMLNGVMMTSACALVTVPLWGYISDRLGRKRVYMFGCVALGLWGFAYFAMLDTRVPWIVFLAVIISMPIHDIQYGPQAALIAESFTGRLRYSGASLGYQLASITAGGPAPLIALTLLQTYKTSTAIAVYVAIAALISLVATALLPDRSKQDLTQEYDAV